MKVGFIGLGTMGASMAANLQKAGAQNLVVHDIRRAAAERHRAAGAAWKPTARRRSPSRCEVILPRCPARRRCGRVALGANGLLAGMKPDTAYFDLRPPADPGARDQRQIAEKNLYMARRAGQRRSEGRGVGAAR